MRISVHPGGAIVVTTPYRSTLEAIERFVRRYAAWAERKVLELRDRTVIRARKSEIPLYKKRALALATEGCAYFAALYGVQYQKISIRAQKSRWGSCSKSGNLSFNYKIALLPKEISDYVIAHEICHLLQFDHSRRFWSEVEKTIPNHREIRKEIRKISILFE